MLSDYKLCSFSYTDDTLALLAGQVPLLTLSLKILRLVRLVSKKFALQFMVLQRFKVSQWRSIPRKYYLRVQEETSKSLKIILFVRRSKNVSGSNENVIYSNPSQSFEIDACRISETEFNLILKVIYCQETLLSI